MNNDQIKGDSVVGVGLPLDAVRTGGAVVAPWRITPDADEWSAVHDGNGASVYCGIRDADGKVVALAVAHDPGYWSRPECAHIAQHIVACVNAPLGDVSVPSETAAGAQKQDHPSEIAELEQEASLMRARNERLQQERDALLEALTYVVRDLEMRADMKRGADKGLVDIGHGAYEQAREAIAKAGGAA